MHRAQKNSFGCCLCRRYAYKGTNVCNVLNKIIIIERYEDTCDCAGKLKIDIYGTDSIKIFPFSKLFYLAQISELNLNYYFTPAYIQIQMVEAITQI